MNLMLRLVTLFLFGFFCEVSVSQEQRSVLANAKWIADKVSPGILIDVSEALTPSQQDIVNSGFSTFTLLAIREEKLQSGITQSEVRVVCSVKYDTWEERYQAVRVEPLPLETMAFKTYKDWGKKCLQITVTVPDVVNKLKSGGHLTGVLQIRQSSPDESAKIKNWLVKQQSGFMQGLYAHMLGDFQFQGSVKLDISIPAFASTLQNADQESAPSKKKEGQK
jgi:hypothetical protein